MSLLVVGTGATLTLFTLSLLIAVVLTELAHRLFQVPRESAFSSLEAHRLPLWSLFPSLVVSYAMTLGIVRLIARRRRAKKTGHL